MEDILCDACLDGDNYEDDYIMICDQCNSAAHQSCYGNDIRNRIPSDDEKWYC